ncbi:hypothetical protein K461DRAFT_75179 [Myriangium duriaei CBS 260.36]|uniref:Uncharacterized protein n=1 Tax=Myriangium duriaei CBS 260.36 TaxID=1168546 RepID=A0A9P4J647_9PEZI|nr:hypothetical protein K461DRAFT_75179 [Myriangium duriaei CBS 260.36]
MPKEKRKCHHQAASRRQLSSHLLTTCWQPVRVHSVELWYRNVTGLIGRRSLFLLPPTSRVGRVWWSDHARDQAKGFPQVSIGYACCARGDSWICGASQLRWGEIRAVDRSVINRRAMCLISMIPVCAWSLLRMAGVRYVCAARTTLSHVTLAGSRFRPRRRVRLSTKTCSHRHHVYKIEQLVRKPRTLGGCEIRNETLQGNSHFY